MAPLYEDLCADLDWTQDASRAQKMRGANEARCRELDAKVTDAEENLGDVEVREALLAKADYLCRIGTKLLHRFCSECR